MIISRTIGMMFLAAGCLGLCSCTADKGKCCGRADQKSASIQEIDSLYTLATSNHHQAFRKPAQDEQARALRMLSQKADQMVAETATWDSPARLTSLNDAERASARNNVGSFRTSLQGLKTAADARNLGRLRQEYAATKASYARLIEKLDYNH